MSPNAKDPAEYQRRMEEVAGDAAREHAADEAFEREPSRGSRLGVAVVLALALAGVLVWNVRIARMGTPPLPTYEQERSLMGVVTVLSRQVEAVRASTGAYPASLDAVAPPLDGVTYRLTAGGYQLEAVAGDVVVTFMSDRDPQMVAGRVATPAGGPR